MNLRITAVTTISLLAIFSTAALAGSRDDVLEAMGKCATLTDDKARLGCYDAMAPRLRDALNAPPEIMAHPPTKEEQQNWFGFNLGNWFGGNTPPAGQTTPGQFGADNLAAAPAPAAPAGTPAAPVEPQQIDSITAKVTDYSFTPFGKFIIFLDNGQVWREVDADLAHFSRDGNTVTIQRGAFTSYNLTINDGNHVYKVMRVK